MIPWLSIPPEMWTVQLRTTGIHAAELLYKHTSPSAACELSSTRDFLFFCLSLNISSCQ